MNEFHGNKAFRGNRYFHYTTSLHFWHMEQTGIIEAGTDCGDIFGLPLVWISTNPVWEPSTGKSISGAYEHPYFPHTRDGLVETGNPPLRLEINPKLISIYSWTDLKKLYRVQRKVLQQVELFASIHEADPNEWFACHDFIPLKACYWCPEVWDGTRWVATTKVNFYSLAKPIQPDAGDRTDQWSMTETLPCTVEIRHLFWDYQSLSSSPEYRESNK